MPYWYLVGSFVAGVVVGAGGVMLYLQYRTRKQLRQMENQMGALMQDFQMPEEQAD